MSNYSQITFFAPKDSLPSGNPNKLILGAQVDPELAAISVAIATKYDAAAIAGGPILFNSGNVGAPGIAFSGDTGTGIYRIGAGHIGITLSGTEALDIAATAITGPAFVVNGSTVPANGIYLSAANSLSFASNTVLRATIDSNGRWTFAAPGATGQTGYTFNGLNGNNTAIFQTGAGAGTAFGVVFKAGTTSADYAALFQTQGGTSIFKVQGDGTLQCFGPVAGAFVDMTADSGTFTVTITGCTTAPTATATWYRIGKQVTLVLPALNATSSSTSLTFTGLPAAIQPATLTQRLYVPESCVENAGAIASTVDIQVAAGSGTLTFLLGGSTTGFTNSATAKGTTNPFAITYLLN